MRVQRAMRVVADRREEGLGVGSHEVGIAGLHGTRHAERHDLGVARSRFLQVAGHYDGTVTLAGRVHVLRGVPGVGEDQAVRW